jgi:hypothetical protein
MPRLRSLTFILLAGSFITAACGGSSDPNSNDGGTILPDGGTRLPDGGTVLPDGGTRLPDGGTVLPDGGTVFPDGGVAGTLGTSTTMHLDSATVQVTGRQGLDVRLTLTGGDTAKGIASVMVRVLDGAGNPVAGFDSHQSGTLDSEVGPATLAASVLGKTTIATTATLEGMAQRAPQVAIVAVSLRDLHGLTSNEIVATVVAQPVRQQGAACDPNALLNRCVSPLGCNGTSPTCGAAHSPAITKLAFLRGAAGPTLLMSGTEPQDNLSNIHVDFEDAAGNSILVPLDGDNSGPVASFDLDATGFSTNGTFLVSLQQATGFDTACPQIAVTPEDAIGNTGTTLSAKPSDVPVRAAGAVCDPQGFDACVSGNVCTPGVAPAASTCRGLVSLQTAVCTGAVQLAPVLGATATTFGHTALPSLWDAPNGCSGFNPIGRPEGIAKLVLATTAATLTLSLDNPGTDFDTTMYLMPGCPQTSASSLACDDDGPIGVSSVIVLNNVPAGTYTVVVDSFKPHGGNYQLTADVE